MHLFTKLFASTCKLRDKNATAVKKGYNSDESTIDYYNLTNSNICCINFNDQDTLIKQSHFMFI